MVSNKGLKKSEGEVGRETERITFQGMKSWKERAIVTGVQVEEGSEMAGRYETTVDSRWHNWWGGDKQTRCLRKDLYKERKKTPAVSINDPQLQKWQFNGSQTHHYPKNSDGSKLVSPLDVVPQEVTCYKSTHEAAKLPAGPQQQHQQHHCTQLPSQRHIDGSETQNSVNAAGACVITHCGGCQTRGRGQQHDPSTPILYFQHLSDYGSAAGSEVKEVGGKEGG